MTTQDLYSKYYYSTPGFLDGTAQFHGLCRRVISPGTTILEVGSGFSNLTTEYLASLGRVVGVDVSEAVRSNHCLSSHHVYDGHRLPFANGLFGACVSNYVLEHIRWPEEHFREVGRVLRPGGVYCFRTPNLWHYVTLGSWLLPHSLHLLLANPLRRMTMDAEEPFPTVYGCNTRRAVRKLCKSAGLRVTELSGVEKEPSYGKAHAALFFPMMLYERAVNSSSLFEGIRVNLQGAATKIER